jgi:hypothetical protein
MIRLDVRGLNHPEPLERSVETMRRLDGTNCMHLRIHRFPKPLLLIAQKQGVRFDACETPDGEWHILFTRNPSLDLKTMVRELCDV